ncbi:MAG: PilZ domain-containing protein [Nitrospinales bacterium]
MENPRDRRNFPRATVRMNAFILDQEEKIPIQIEDLTVRGIAFLINRNLQPRSTIFVGIKDSGEIRNNGLKVEVLRCESLTNGSATQYRVAAKILQVNDEYLMDALALVHGKKQ